MLRIALTNLNSLNINIKWNDSMKKFNFISIVACVVFCLGFASCDYDEPVCNCTCNCGQVKEEPEISTEQEVDLGLPSGTIWAGWNVGASSPEQLGGYYAWGETEEKTSYDKDTYKYYNPERDYYSLGGNISGTSYDVARQKWGGSWRMPTKKNIDELNSMCRLTWYQYKGAWGQKVTGPNGKSIFLPAAGRRWGASLDSCGYSGFYWSDSRSYEGTWYLGFGNGFYSSGHYGSHYGHTVRPVK